ncbi:GDSL-like Lipase/Acylhydrolase [Stachybotrys elegans]|uniref:GDSL-like Lipase/Acylhydrolase n=1 Tax=Stachybotrys elegans TaxID=80388 RepID=A0A8K0WND1_9HYPO|nr:GDSL-like Lipase/Acylhydrolase [Stachybotrys elegans]
MKHYGNFVTAVTVSIASLLPGFALASNRVSQVPGNDWVTLWGAMPQLTEPANLPPPPFNRTGRVFDNSSIRQTVKVSLDADVIRLQLTNAFGGSDLPITAVTVALPSEQVAGISGIQQDTLQTLTFSGTESFIIPNGAVVVSDPVEFSVAAQSILSISIYLQNGQATNYITSHPGSRTTSHFVSGNHINDEDFEGGASADHWYFIDSIEGQLSEGSTIAFVGDSITDGRGSTTNGNDRWPDQLLSRMQESGRLNKTAILNVAAGGNRILADGLGPNALGRIDRDVISHSGVEYAIIFEGINDIGTGPTDATTQRRIGERVIQAYDQMIHRLHRRGITVYGATLTPAGGSDNGYGHPNREVTRQTLNTWIRENGKFDAVIDFDAATRDPQQPTRLLPRYDTGDHLHLNPAGFAAMAAAVDLELFQQSACKRFARL